MVSLVFCCILLFVSGGGLGGFIAAIAIGKELIRKEKNGEIIFVEKVDH